MGTKVILFPDLPVLVKIRLKMCHGVKIELIVSLKAVVSVMRRDFHNCHIFASNVVTDERSRSFTCTPFIRQGVKIEVIFAQRAVVSDVHETW